MNTHVHEARGFSLWLEPDAALRADLAPAIQRLASETATTPFDPHVTLLGGLPDDETAARQLCRVLARQACPTRLRLLRATQGSSYFHCVFIEIEPTTTLLRLRERATALAHGADAPLAPHLSLVYGDFSARRRRTLARSVPSLHGRAFVARHVRLVRTAGPVDAWLSIACFPFGGATR
jgi:putative hydrolase of the HAD superfamily